MRMRILVLTALLTNTLLGNICMMDMAHAAMPMEEGNQDVMEMMNMSPMYPMSQADCPGCEHEEGGGRHQTPAPTSSPCDSGHCLSTHGMEVSGMKESPLPIQGAIPAVLQDVMTYSHDDTVPHRRTENLPLVSGTSTIVLRE